MRACCSCLLGGRWGLGQQLIYRQSWLLIAAFRRSRLAFDDGGGGFEQQDFIITRPTSSLLFDNCIAKVERLIGRSCMFGVSFVRHPLNDSAD